MFGVLRAVALALVIALAFTTIAWLATGQPKWRRYAWIIFKYGVFGLLLMLLLFAGEALLH